MNMKSFFYCCRMTARAFFIMMAFASPVLMASNGLQVREPIKSVCHPIDTPLGVVFTDEWGAKLFLSHNGTTEVLFSAPGCGIYFTLSPDKSTIGFKEIFEDGKQAPAIINVLTKKVTLLHSPVPQCGQVGFSTNGTIAYSIGNDVYIVDPLRGNQNGTQTKRMSIGTYANIVALSSDATYLAYVDRPGRVFVFDITTGQSRQISGPGCMMPLWSPAGMKLCYSSLSGKLFVFDAQSRGTYALGDGTSPAWTPDGASLIVARQETRGDTLVNSDLYQISFDGKETIRLTATKNIFEIEPSIDAEGTVLFSDVNNNAIYSATLGNKSLKINSSVEIRDEKFLSNPADEKSASAYLAGAPSASPYFEVPYVNQVYDTPIGYPGSDACAPTSSIMVIAYYNLLPEWDLNQAVPTKHVSHYGNYVFKPYHFHGNYFTGSPYAGGYGFMWNVSDPYHTMADYYIAHGLSASELDSPSLDSVISEVSSGHPYTLCNLLTSVGHVIVVNGVGDKEGSVMVNDPYGNKNLGYWPNFYGKDVQYDWPGYNNGNQNLNEAAWGVSVRLVSQSVPDSIVDDLGFNDGFVLCNTSPASMSLWLDRSGLGYDGHFWYTYTRTSDTCSAKWFEPSLLQEGNYEVLAYIPSGTANVARYHVYYKGDSATVVIDQSMYRNQWASLGVFPFGGGDSGYVKLGDGSDSVGQVLEFDAMAWSYRSPLLVQNESQLPSQFRLNQNYPNPFNPSTIISYQIPDVADVSLKVYDILGREVMTLVKGKQVAGLHTVAFDGSRLSSGVYLYRLTAGTFVDTKKLVLMK